jgi:Dyp-type peroxidase family
MMKQIEQRRQPAAFTALQEQRTTLPGAPEEPIVDVGDVQGNIVPGFNKPMQCFTAYRFGDAAGAKAWLRAIEPYIATAEEVLAFRRLFRQRRDRHGGRMPTTLADTNTNVAFSFAALQKLVGNAAETFTDVAFREGLQNRSPLLGEPTDPKNEGAPRNWIVGGPDNLADALVITGSDRDTLLEERTKAIDDLANVHGLTKIYQELGSVRNDLRGHEMFGFDDGVSQPAARGRISASPDEYLTARYITEAGGIEGLLYALPGQDLVWTGEFLFGYPAQGPDPLIAGPIRTGCPDWAKNGSYLAFNRFRQDVRLFWTFMKDEAAKLAAEQGFAGLEAERLAALLVGRWMSGAPVSRSPQTDNPDLGGDQYANNHFFYGVDTHVAPLIDIHGYKGDHYPNAQADPIGLTCPLASHIRKVNTRDVANDQGGHNATYTARVLRRGIPFGKPLADPFGKDPDKGNRGLLFVSFQTSLVEQYELLRGTWMGDNLAPRMPGGDDLIVGMNGRPGERRERKCTLFGTGGASTTVSTGPEGGEWVIPTGGGYFFAPSLSAIRGVLSA